MQKSGMSKKILAGLGILNEMKALVSQKGWRVKKTIYIKERRFGEFYGYYFYSPIKDLNKPWLGIITYKRSPGIFAGASPGPLQTVKLLLGKKGYHAWWWITEIASGFNKYLIPQPQIVRINKQSPSQRTQRLKAILKKTYPFGKGNEKPNKAFL